jgi:hypothetical protein
MLMAHVHSLFTLSSLLNSCFYSIATIVDTVYTFGETYLSSAQFMGGFSSEKYVVIYFFFDQQHIKLGRGAAVWH